MENAIRKIFSGKADEEVHSDFLKFSRGLFENKYLLEGKKQKDKWAVKTSAEFANFLVRKCLEKVSGNVKATGAIICTFSLQGKIEFERVKQFAGVKQHLINGELSAEKILKLMDEYPRAFYALSFSTPACELKIKAKAPKSAKPGTKTKDDEGPRADFCSAKTTDLDMIKDLFFDFPNFNEIKINHTLEIKEVIIPSGVSDPVKMRALSKRKGVVKRFIEIDGKKEVKEAGFEI
jgi:hypothetical protein